MHLLYAQSYILHIFKVANNLTYSHLKLANMTSKEYGTRMYCDNKSNSRYYARHPTFDCNVVSSIELGIPFRHRLKSKHLDYNIISNYSNL